MIEVKGNLWDAKTDAICITTNGFVRKDGAAVMGRGCAAEAKELFPGIEFTLGKMISIYGNHAYHLPVRHGRYDAGEGMEWNIEIFSFPVKHHWRERAEFSLIRRSAKEMVEQADFWELGSITLPRPGCGNGGLDWTEVKEVIEPILDDRFKVITF